MQSCMQYRKAIMYVPLALGWIMVLGLGHANSQVGLVAWLGRAGQGRISISQRRCIKLIQAYSYWPLLRIHGGGRSMAGAWPPLAPPWIRHWVDPHFGQINSSQGGALGATNLSVICY